MRQQPWSHWLSSMKTTRAITALPGTDVAACKIAAFGHSARSEQVGFISNCREIIQELEVQEQLVAPKCVATLLRGLRRAFQRIGMLDEMFSGPAVEEHCPALAGDYGKVYYDEVTGLQLPTHLVEEALLEEIKHMRQLSVCMGGDQKVV